MDKIRISARGGFGGKGCCSYFQTRNRKNIPDGGNGGNGGSIFIRSTSKRLNLTFGRSNFVGKPGQNGSSNLRHGKNGKDVIVDVPLGTIVKILDQDNNVTQSTDLLKENEILQICKGGKGGSGNNLRSKFLKDVSFSIGAKPDFIKVELELKSIADIGLVGYPNSGKSTLLSVLSKAKPKCASYPFTTLKPNIGVLVDSKDQANSKHAEYNILVADIPGLVKGASDNRGLGHDFLRHIERTKMLLYVIDIASTDFRDPYEDFVSLKNELFLYSKKLIEKPSIIFANKIDISNHKTRLNITKLKELSGLNVFGGSALKELRIHPLIKNIKKTLIKI